MSFLNNLKKKNNVPEELPDLANDEIEKKLEDHNKTQKSPETEQIVHDYLSKKKQVFEPLPKSPLHNEINSPYKTTDNSEKIPESQKPSPRSFFSELQENIIEELDDTKKIQDWFNKEFSSQDIVSEMRDYWEKQKTNAIVYALGRNFKERIAEKILELKKLEREWQEKYFDMIEKEEEIKEQEKELKSLLQEFVEVCKRQSDNSANNEKEQKIKKRYI